MSTIEPLYSCDVCGLELRPQDMSVNRLALVWLRGKGRTVASVQQERHMFRHSVCKGADPENMDQPPLF